MRDIKLKLIIDRFIVLLNQAIVGDKESFHKFYLREGIVKSDKSIVLENNILPVVLRRLTPLEYLTAKYKFQNSSYSFFVGYNDLKKNMFLPLIRFGYCEDTNYAFCYNFETEEVIITFEETNEIYDYCAPNLQVFFELLIAFIPHLSSYNAMLAEINGTYSRENDLKVAYSIIQQFNLNQKYQHYVIRTLAGEDF